MPTKAFNYKRSLIGIYFRIKLYIVSNKKKFTYLRAMLAAVEESDIPVSFFAFFFRKANN
jgi:hypothetical protein